MSKNYAPCYSFANVTFVIKLTRIGFLMAETISYWNNG